MGIDTVVHVFHCLLDDRDGVRTFRFRIDTFLVDDRGDLFECRLEMLSAFFVRHL